MILRDYQRIAVNNVMDRWQGGTKNVLLVAPTGSGKTVLAEEIGHRARAAGAGVLWICHRIELVQQAKEHLSRRGLLEGTTVATVQALLATGDRPSVGLTVLDECHHYAASEWRTLADHYKDVRTVGLTATPERGDGRPLGDIFQEMVVAANYSELIRDGHIVDCKVWQPPRVNAGGLALDPLDAYEKYAPGEKAFVFCRTVEQAYDVAKSFDSAKCIEANTSDDDRRSWIDQFRAGGVRVLTNVYVLTEGFDAPDASVCILARGCGHASTYLQMVGRVLRSSPGKTHATLIDLSGASLVHGLPTEDREYSLHGTAPIGRTSTTESLRVCLKCGFTFVSAPACPSCGFVMPSAIPDVRIYSQELREVYRAEETVDWAKRHELDRLRALAASRDWSVGWVVREYRKLFGAAPRGGSFSIVEKHGEWQRLIAKGYGRKYALARYKATFGVWPERVWR